jgi:hypothetical protein
MDACCRSCMCLLGTESELREKGMKIVDMLMQWPCCDIQFVPQGLLHVGAYLVGDLGSCLLLPPCLPAGMP